MKTSQKKGQTALEYMLLLAAVMIFVMISLKTELLINGENLYNSAETYFNRVAQGISGEQYFCGNNICESNHGEDKEATCCAVDCPMDCHCGDGVCDSAFGEDTIANCCSKDCAVCT